MINSIERSQRKFKGIAIYLLFLVTLGQYLQCYKQSEEADKRWEVALLCNFEVFWVGRDMVT
jgi:hypothetical protein